MNCNLSQILLKTPLACLICSNSSHVSCWQTLSKDTRGLRSHLVIFLQRTSQAQKMQRTAFHRTISFWWTTWRLWSLLPRWFRELKNNNSKYILNKYVPWTRLKDRLMLKGVSFAGAGGDWCLEYPPGNCTLPLVLPIRQHITASTINWGPIKDVSPVGKNKCK